MKRKGQFSRADIDTYRLHEITILESYLTMGSSRQVHKVGTKSVKTFLVEREVCRPCFTSFLMQLRADKMAQEHPPLPWHASPKVMCVTICLPVLNSMRMLKSWSVIVNGRGKSICDCARICSSSASCREAAINDGRAESERHWAGAEAGAIRSALGSSCSFDH